MPTSRYQGLEGLRGIVAIMVFATHAGTLFPGVFVVPHGYLGVDLFLMLSGFVLAHAYGPRLQAGFGAWAFVRVRLIRLYPLILAATIAGGAVAAVTSPASAREIATATLRGMLLLPTSTAQDVGFGLWPINPPSWSLFWAIIASLLFWLGLWRMPTRGLVWLTALAALALTFCATLFGSLEIGFLTTHFWGGAARAAFAFPMGVLLYRLRARSDIGVTIPSWLLTAAVIGALAAPATDHRAQFDLLIVMLGFPIMILASADARSIGRWARLGARLSYALYILHLPVIQAVRAAAAQFPPHPAVIDMAVAFALTAIVAYAAARWFDEPFRAWLVRRAIVTPPVRLARA